MSPILPRRNRSGNPGAAGLSDLLQAIIEDDRVGVGELLRRDPGLAQAPVPRPILYTSGICHWIYRGDTPLHLAAAGHREQITRQFLAAGADPNCRGPHRGATPLHYAADGCITGDGWNPRRQVATLRLLVDAGADLRLGDKNGATALHRAVRTRCAAAVKCLLNAGADPSIANLPGSTPLHLAVQNTGRGGSGKPECIAAQREILQALLQHGADPLAPNPQGKTAFASARQEWIRNLLAEPRSPLDPGRSK